MEPLNIIVDQCFPNLSWKTPCPAHFVCLPNQTHPIQFLQSLLMSWWVESGVLDKGDIQKVQGRRASRTGLGSTVVDNEGPRVIKVENHYKNVLVMFSSITAHFSVLVAQKKKSGVVLYWSWLLTECGYYTSQLLIQSGFYIVTLKAWCFGFSWNGFHQQIRNTLINCSICVWSIRYFSIYRVTSLAMVL